MVTTPPADLTLAPLTGPERPLSQFLTTFHLVAVVVDPFTNESAWLLESAARILSHFDQADCRVAWIVAGTPDECRAFLGPWSERIFTFADPDREAIKAFGFERLPAIVHVAMDGTVDAAAEGWDPPKWRAVVDGLAKLLHWSAPVVPGPKDPGPFAGSPALG